MEEQKNEGLSALQESVHFSQSDETLERTKRTLTLKQFIAGLLVLWVVCTFIGKGTSGRYWFEARNESWLWHSHNLSVALLEDDPKFLEKRSSESKPSCIEFFCENGSQTRIKGFCDIVCDGNHPRLQSWLQLKGDLYSLK